MTQLTAALLALSLLAGATPLMSARPAASSGEGLWASPVLAGVPGEGDDDDDDEEEDDEEDVTLALAAAPRA